MDDEEIPPLTDFAQVYSHPEGKIGGIDHNAIAKIVPYKSGLTPLSFPSSPTLEEGRQFTELSQYQEVRLRGFTAKQLKVLESFARLIDDMKLNIFDDSNTPVPISPIFDRQKWLTPLPKHLAPFPLGMGRQGYWEASNDVVWEMLEPVLKFATMVLQKPDTWPWWDAFLSDGYEEVEPNLIREPEEAGIPRPRLLRFRRRAAHLGGTMLSRAATQAQLMSLGRRIDFCLASGYMDAGTAVPMDDSSFSSGQTVLLESWHKTSIYISIEELEPLFNPRLTNVEKMMCYFEVGKTLVHELTHAIWDIMSRNVPNYRYDLDSYFEDENIAELGFSMETAVKRSLPSARESITNGYKIFGGCSSAFNEAVGAGLPGAGIFRTDFPRQDCVGLETAGQPILKNEPNHWHEITSYPVPAIYFANVFRQEFWQLSVRGPNFLHMGPVTFAHVFSSTEAKSLPVGTKYKPKLQPFNHVTDVEVVIKRPATEVEAKRIQIEKLRRDQCERIHQAMKDFDACTREENQLLLQLSTYAPSSSISSSHWTSGSGSSSSKIGVHPDFVPSCHRFEIIRDYLFQHRQTLALDTLYFEIAEHILLYHVRNSGLELEADEWRGFLQICNEGLALFRWRPLGAPPAPVQGMVTRINAGWPAYTPIPRQFPPKPSRNNKISLDTATERLVTTCYTFKPKGNLHDLDNDVFLQLTNKSLAALGKTERADMEDLSFYIAECENSGWRWCFGPEGTIRKMENGW